MACPHSSAPGSAPEKCSQCAMAKAKIVSYDGETCTLLVDGKEVQRTLDAEKKSPPNIGAIHSGGRRPKTCGICGEAGHTRLSCGKN